MWKLNLGVFVTSGAVKLIKWLIINQPGIKDMSDDDSILWELPCVKLSVTISKFVVEQQLLSDTIRLWSGVLACSLSPTSTGAQHILSLLNIPMLRDFKSSPQKCKDKIGCTLNVSTKRSSMYVEMRFISSV